MIHMMVNTVYGLELPKMYTKVQWWNLNRQHTTGEIKVNLKANSTFHLAFTKLKISCHALEIETGKTSPTKWL